jgi:hypothetical protein
MLGKAKQQGYITFGFAIENPYACATPFEHPQSERLQAFLSRFRNSR